MPKLKRSERDQKLFELVVKIQYLANLKEIKMERLAKAAGITKRTLYDRYKHPEKFSLEEISGISQVLGDLGLTF